MSEFWNVSKNIQVNGQGGAVPVNSTVTGDNQYSNMPTVTAADAGTLTTRSSNSGGVVTLSNGHSIVNGRVDMYWSGGKRVGATVSVSTNAATISGGTGDNLPIATTAINLKNPQVLSPTIAGTLAVGVLVQSVLSNRLTNLPGTVVFAQSDATLILQVDLTAAAPNYEWDGLAAASPIPAAVGKIYFSQGNADRSIAMGVNVLYN